MAQKITTASNLNLTHNAASSSSYFNVNLNKIGGKESTISSSSSSKNETLNRPAFVLIDETRKEFPASKKSGFTFTMVHENTDSSKSSVKSSDSTTNKCTLKEHISAYENSMETVDPFFKTAEMPPTESSEKTDPFFSFPRYQEVDAMYEPESMHFKVSEKVFSPHTSAPKRRSLLSPGLFARCQKICRMGESNVLQPQFLFEANLAVKDVLKNTIDIATPEFFEAEQAERFPHIEWAEYDDNDLAALNEKAKNRRFIPTPTKQYFDLSQEIATDASHRTREVEMPIVEEVDEFEETEDSEDVDELEETDEGEEGGESDETEEIDEESQDSDDVMVIEKEEEPRDGRGIIKIAEPRPARVPLKKLHRGLSVTFYLKGRRTRGTINAVNHAHNNKEKITSVTIAYTFNGKGDIINLKPQFVYIPFENVANFMRPPQPSHGNPAPSPPVESPLMITPAQRLRAQQNREAALAIRRRLQNQ